MNRAARIGAGGALVAALVAGVLLAYCGRSEGESRLRASVARSDNASLLPTQQTERRAPRRGRPAPPLALVTMRGVVIDREGAPVAGAVVAVAAPARSVRTGDDGRFEVRGLLPGHYIVEARQGTQIAGPLGVDLDARSREVTLRMYTGYVLEVEVVAHDSGRPIAGADVEIAVLSMHAGAGRQRATTGTDGIAKLEGLTYIGHDLQVSAAGYADERRGPGPDLVERAPGVRRLRIALHRAAAEIAGRLVDESGTAIADGQVEAVVYQGGQRALDDAKLARTFGAVDPHAALRSHLGTRTNADGTFRIGLETGTWVLLASAAGHEVAVSEPLFIEHGGGGRRELTIVLRPGRTVRGVVVDETDREVAAAQVEARWLDGTRVIGKTVADNGGGFELRGLPPAPIELIARGDSGRSRPHRVDLAAGDVEGEVIMLGLAGVIDGRVVDDRGAPIPDAVITYLDEHPGNAPSLYPDVTVSDHEGRFQLTGVAKRVSYIVSASRPLDGAFGQHAASVTARAGDNVTITIPAGGAIVGRIVGAPDPRKILVRDRQTSTVARPGADGRFRLDRLPALHYELRVSGASIADTYVQNIEVALGRDTDIGDVVVRPGRRVAGVVVDGSGRPVEEASVRIEVDDRYAIVTRAAGGRFSLSVPAAPLRISASHLAAGRTAVLALGATQNATGLRLAMLPGGTIRGVARAHGEGLADARVTVWPTTDRPAEPTAATITDDAGEFTIPSVPAGRWLVEVSIPALEREHRVIQRGVELAVGAVVELDIDASKAPDGTIVQPRPARPELPTYGEESDDDH